MRPTQSTVIIHGKRISDLSPRAGRPECGLWGVTRANARFWHGRLTDWTEWFDIHPLVETRNFAGIPERRPDAWNWYRRQDGSRPIWMMAPEDHPADSDRKLAAERFALIPGAQRFPIRDIQQHFPINGEPNRWFVEQAGMMMAFAAMRRATHLILNGIGCVQRPDFFYAHRSILYWVGFLRGAGITVTIEGPSIFNPPSEIYSYQKFNHADIAPLQEQQRRIALGLAADIQAQLEVNDRERRRGRPPRFRLTPPEDR